ncbi:MAG: acetate--CoA ligase family protein, partial [Xanthobacteraceae bacterium]
LTNDFAEDVGLELPDLEAATLAKVKEVLPAFGNYGNPLDVTAGFSPDGLTVATKALIDDPNVGMLFISFPINLPLAVQNFNKGMAHSPKPKVMVALGDNWQLPPETLQEIKQSPAVFARSSDRMLRAITLYTRYGRLLGRTSVSAAAAPFPGMPKLGTGAQPEWLGKKVLAAAGIRVPQGELARTAEEAVAVASRIGYPVVLKAQAAALTHKTEAGGVELGLSDAAALRAAWSRMHESVRRSSPGVSLEGCLVETMSPKGLELMIGAKRDPEWDTVLLVGLGGIWVEALGDVQVLPVDADERQVIEALYGLRVAKLLRGFRGTPPVDVKAVAAAVLAIGRLMRTSPEIVEVDINPLMVFADGEGATALDALIVTK